MGVNDGSPIYTTLQPGQESPFKVYTDVSRFNNDHYVVTIGALKLGKNNQNVNATSINGSSNNLAADRTFKDCYSDMALRMLLASALTPSSSFNVDVTDADMKKFITNSCNFYFQKTGVWIGNPIADEVMTPKLVEQFNLKYNATFPESYRKLIEEINNATRN